MIVRQLESFVRVAELGGFSKAARVTGIAQPALSRQVRLLETDLRETLLLRNGRGVALPPTGRQLFKHGRADPSTRSHRRDLDRHAFQAHNNFMSSPLITGISSMATRALLAELTAAYGLPVSIESVGGVDATKRVLAGELFDVVVLARDAIDKLVAAGRVVAGSQVDVAQSGVAVAVPAGAAHPDIASEDAVKRAVLAAPSLGYSTGPSGVQLARLFERWGITEQIAPRIVQAPPGVPVGALVARGEVALGFQQLSELMGVQGIDVIGPLPPAIQITTTFAAGVCAASTQPDAARSLLAFLASPATAKTKQRQGMEQP